MRETVPDRRDALCDRQSSSPVFLCLWNMGARVVQFFVPQRVRGSFCFIEESGIEEGCKRNLAEIRLHLADFRADPLCRVRSEILSITTISAKFDLVDQEVNERPPVLIVTLQAMLHAASCGRKTTSAQ